MDWDIKKIAEEGEFVALDVEGDGNSNHRAVEISMVRFKRGEPVEEFHWLLNPRRPISNYVSKLHGITDEMVEGCPTFAEVEDEITNIMSGSVVVAHSIKDDMKILRQDVSNIHELPSLRIDTLRFAKNSLPGKARYGLQSMLEMLNLSPVNASELHHPLFSNAPERVLAHHSARYDAIMCGKAFLALCKAMPPSPKAIRHITNAVILSPHHKMFEVNEPPVDSGSVKTPKL